MKHFFQPTAQSPLLEWLAFIGLLLLPFIVVAAVIVMMKTGRQGAPSHRKRKHRHHRPTNPTLAQTKGLPPRRDPNAPPPGP